MIRLVIPRLPPSANHYKKPRRSRRGELAGFYVTDEAKQFFALVATVARDVTPIAKGHVEVSAVLFRGEKNGKIQRGDLLNYEKVLCDSLEGYAFRNDSQIRRATFELREDRANPRVEVTITPLETPKSRPKTSGRGKTRPAIPQAAGRPTPSYIPPSTRHVGEPSE